MRLGSPCRAAAKPVAEIAEAASSSGDGDVCAHGGRLKNANLQGDEVKQEQRAYLARPGAEPKEPKLEDKG